MAERVIATQAALTLIEKVERQCSPPMFHQSGGCCDGSARMRYPRDQSRTGASDVAACSELRRSLL
jgi:uncharacterized protein (DUF779 family)